MIEFEIYKKGITAGQMSKWFDVGYQGFCDTLNNEFKKKFESHSTLLKKHYDFVVNYYYINEENFKRQKYGMFLRAKEFQIDTAIKDYTLFLQKECKKILIDELNKNTNLLDSNILDTTKLLPYIDTTFEIFYKGKAGDDDTVNIYYQSKFGNLKFTKNVESLREFSGRPFKIKQEYEKKEIEFKLKIPKVKIELIGELVFFKQLDFFKIFSLDQIFNSLLDLNSLEVKKYKLKALAQEISEKLKKENKTDFYNYYLMPTEKFAKTDYFGKLDARYIINNEINYFKSKRIHFE